MKKIILGMVFLCAAQANFAHASIKVVTTIGQITDVVKNVGGEHVAVIGLMGAGVDPHLYKASESDVRKLAEADIIFYNGLYLEAKMEDIFKQMLRNKVTAAVGEPIEKNRLLDSVSYAGHHDPHIWFDVSLWMQVVQTVTDTLSKFDPVNAQEYQIRADEYLLELKKLDQYVEGRASELEKEERVLVTAHDAFRYFGRRYDFEVIGLQGLSTESEAGAKDVMGLADLIAQRKIRAIFVESSVPERNIKAVQQAVKARGWNVEIGGELFSDAMGDAGTFEGTYIGMVTHNIDTIVDALK